MIFSRLLLITASLAVSFFATPLLADDLDLTHYRGKVVYIDFWASWCGPCRESFPWMNKVLAKYKKEGLVIVAVNLDQDRKDAQNFLKKIPADFPILYNPDASLAEKYHIIGVPSALIFDRQGKLIHQHPGFNAKRSIEYEQVIQAALQAQVI